MNFVTGINTFPNSGVPLQRIKYYFSMVLNTWVNSLDQAVPMLRVVLGVPGKIRQLNTNRESVVSFINSLALLLRHFVFIEVPLTSDETEANFGV